MVVKTFIVLFALMVAAMIFVVAMTLTAAGTAHAANGHDGLSEAHELSRLGGMARNLVTRFAGNGSSGSSTHTTRRTVLDPTYRTIWASRDEQARLGKLGYRTSLKDAYVGKNGVVWAKVLRQSERPGGVNLGPTSTFRGKPINLGPDDNSCNIC